jgi:transcriptional regulator GlxA family with amidase domain
MKIVVVGSEGCLASGLVGLVDLLSLARLAIAESRAAPAPFEVVSASIDGRPVRDGLGRCLEVDAALAEVNACDALIIPGFVPDAHRRPPDLRDRPELATWIRHQHARGALACGSCSGVFLLGEAGLLDGHRCTTTWWLYDEMRRRYPRAQAGWGLALAEDRRVISAGGPLSWIDLALHVVRALCGDEAARIAADFAVVDTAPSTQAVYIPAGHLATADPFLAQAEHLVRQLADRPLTARELARRLASSERTLHRRLAEATGESPKRFIDRIRFEMAKASLEMGTAPIKQIAAAAGYRDESSFRRAFARLSGMSPAAYRRWAQERRERHAGPA